MADTAEFLLSQVGCLPAGNGNDTTATEESQKDIDMIHSGPNEQPGTILCTADGSGDDSVTTGEGGEVHFDAQEAICPPNNPDEKNTTESTEQNDTHQTTVCTSSVEWGSPLGWAVDGLKVSPKWEWSPTIQSIEAALKSRIRPNEQYNISPMRGGTCSKLYSVDYGGHEYVLKVTLPVAPRTKTESEVATMRWMRKNTNLSVPRVIQYDSSANNPIGCEWILMTRIEGRPLSSYWCEMEFGSKERIVMRIAEFTAHIYNHQFTGIGNIYPSPLPSPVRRHQVGRIVCPRFFWHRGPEIERQQGPFITTREWVLRRLNIAHEQLRDRFHGMKNGPKKDVDLIWRMLNMSGVGSRLWRLYDVLFPRRIKTEALKKYPAYGPETQQTLTGDLRQASVQDTDQHMNGWPTPMQIDYDQRDKTSADYCNTIAKPDLADITRIACGNICKLSQRASDGCTTQDSQLNTQYELPAQHIKTWEPLKPDFKDHIGADADPDPDPEPTMLWRTNLSADDIFVNENGILTGVVGWGSVPAIPVAIACDWPAFLHEGRHRVTEPQIRHYYDRDQKCLKMNFWRALRDCERTQLRKLFTEEMARLCPRWYATWQREALHRDYEAAVQHCDNVNFIDKVEQWCDQVEAALEKGLEPKPPHVMSLACAVTEGPDWTSWTDLDDLTPKWVTKRQEHDRELAAWCQRVAKVKYARAEIRRAKSVRQKATKARIAAEADLRHYTQKFEVAARAEHEADTRLAQDKMASAEVRLSSAKRKVNAAGSRLLAAEEKIREEEEPRARDREAWESLRKALVKEFGEDNYWVRETRYTPRDAGEAAGSPRGTAPADGDMESEISEEE
ncbi:uncharacterized protein JN550_013769 [Neoarthrinium moseri]|uniref:uncharacterized protein n=1 Tax=Neoarthrinium moseri TaxID=1658444 RepID=UPI001FDC86B6|nr:uncharacterized protein JN550_013769 [Neoarthrinium moseri]KAI1856507.1 hypothetical protein JN550_013769 [Neoarthrinium moseri]